MYLACFCFSLHFELFRATAFFSPWKMATGIFSHLLWYHSPQTEQNAMKNPLSSFGSSSKNSTRRLQYNGKRCITSFPGLTCLFVVGTLSLFRFPTVLIDVSSLHLGCKFFIQAYGCTRYRLQKLLQIFRYHTHSLAAAPLLKLCKALHLQRAICLTRFLFRLSFCNESQRYTTDVTLSVGEETVTQWLFSSSTWTNSPVWTENIFNGPMVVSSKPRRKGKFLNIIVYAIFIDSSDSHLFSMISLCIALLNFWFTRCLILASIFFVPTISTSFSITAIIKI